MQQCARAAAIWTLRREAVRAQTCTAGVNFARLPAYNRHLEGTVLTFADGHVKWFKMPQGPVVACGNTAGNNCVQSDKIYHFNVPMSTSGSNPTFATQ